MVVVERSQGREASAVGFGNGVTFLLYPNGTTEAHPMKRFSLITLFCLVLASTPLHAAARYTIQPLESHASQIDVVAGGINDQQQVVGYIIEPDGTKRAALWENKTVRLLPSLVDGAASWAFRLNNRGEIVGKAATADGSIHAVLWDGHGVHDIGALPGGKNSFASDINELGVVAGSSEAAVGSNAFTWTAADGFHSVASSDPPLRLTVAGFNGINDAGFAVGTTYYLLEPYRAAAAEANARLVTDISPPGRNVGMAMAVNNHGVIVGYQSETNAAPQAAILHGDGTFTQLGTLGLDESWAHDVNDNGTIVGRAFSFLPGGQIQPAAFVYENGQMDDLLRISANNEGWESLIEASSINSAGVIVGEGIFQGEVRAYIAFPVPEPTLGWLAIGVLVFAIRKRR